jgi:hypothetical protein
MKAKRERLSTDEFLAKLLRTLSDAAESRAVVPELTAAFAAAPLSPEQLRGFRLIAGGLERLAASERRVARLRAKGVFE